MQVLVQLLDKSSGARHNICMQTPCPHLNQIGGKLLILFLGITVDVGAAAGQSLQSLLNHAPTTTAPAVKFAPKANLHPFAAGSKGMFAIRIGTVELSTGQILRGQIWTTQQTPFRVWLKKLKQYRDIDIRLVREIVGSIRYSKQIRQYKFQQMGSDIKLYTGRTRPRIGYRFTFKLIDGRQITGTVIAPIYIRTADGRNYFYLLKKRIEGKLGQKASSIAYIRQIRFQVTPAERRYAKMVTRQLPLLNWRHLLKTGK
jgi:hypothetical protein